MGLGGGRQKGGAQGSARVNPLGRGKAGRVLIKQPLWGGSCTPHSYLPVSDCCWSYTSPASCFIGAKPGSSNSQAASEMQTQAWGFCSSPTPHFLLSPKLGPGFRSCRAQFSRCPCWFGFGGGGLQRGLTAPLNFTQQASKETQVPCRPEERSPPHPQDELSAPGSPSHQQGPSLPA